MLMSIFSYLPICSLLVVRAGLHMETEVQIDLHATHPSANKMVRYSCSSGLGDVVLGSPLEPRPVSRRRGDFFLSPGLPAAAGSDSSGPLGDAVSRPPLGEAVGPARPLAPRVPLVDGLAVTPPDGLADAVAFGLAAAVARGLAEALVLGEAVPIAASDIFGCRNGSQTRVGQAQ